MRCCSYQYPKATDHSYHECLCLCSAKVHVSLVDTACLHYISDIHYPTCSKISPVHLQTRQEHQNGRVWTSLGSKLEETTTLDVLHYPMGSEIGPVHLHLPQERQNGGVQTSLQPKVEETTTLSVSYYPMVSKSVWCICSSEYEQSCTFDIRPRPKFSFKRIRPLAKDISRR